LAMGVNPILLLKETEELEQPSEAKRSWQNVAQKALYDKMDDWKSERFLNLPDHVFHSGPTPYLHAFVLAQRQ